MPQVELGATPSSYIPTSGASATRAADTLTIPAANMPWPDPEYVTGTELVTNGTFDTDTTGWTAISGATLSVVSGELVVTNAGGDGFAGAEQAITTEAGRTYAVTFDVVTAGPSGWDCNIGTTSNSSDLYDGAVSTETGTITVFFTATSTTSYVGLVSRNAGGSSTFDNISVKEIYPLSVSIAMSGMVTYADENLSIQSTFLRWTIDGNTRIEARLDTNATLIGSVTFLQTASGVSDVVVSSATAYSPGINVPFKIASRHGTNFINGAVNGTVLTANTTPTSLPDLSATDLSLGDKFNGYISKFRVWGDDIGDTGIAEASE